MESEVQPQASLDTRKLFLAWLLALIPAASLLALVVRPVWDVDIFWQLKLGEIILARHGPLRTEPFAALHLGEPMPAVAWLGQAIMAGVRLIGGWSVLRVFDALCWLGGFWVVAAACRARGAGRGAAMLALLLAFAVSEQTASIRPQSFAILCFGVLLALQRLRLRSSITVMIGAPLLVVWQNLHPSESVALMVTGIHAVLDMADWLRDRNRPLRWANAALAVMAAGAMFATPDGAGILAVSLRNAESSVAIGASEWLPLWAADNRENALRVLFAICGIIVLLLKTRARPDVRELATTFALLVLTVVAYRFVLFWAVTTVPVATRAIGGLLRPQAEPDLPRGTVGLPVVAVALVGLLLPTTFDARLPIAAIAKLKRQNVRGTIYGDFPFGGAIIDGGYPDWRVAYDGRYWRYSSDEWKYNGGIENGYVPLVDIVRKWSPAAFVLNATHNAPIAEELAHSRSWRRVYDRDEIVVYVRRRR